MSVALAPRFAPVLLLVVPVLSTFAGGMLAFRFRRSLGLLTAVGAGLLLGAAFLDLLPEALSFGQTAAIAPANVLGVALLSFLFFYALESAMEAFAERWKLTPSRRSWKGKVGGATLIFHSFRDGMAIGLSYAASHAAGYAVAVGIAAHDLGDGMNTVILTSGGEPADRSDFLFLVADSVAPFVGGLATAWWIFSTRSSVILLSVAAGFFIQLATSDFLPRVRRDGLSRMTAFAAVVCGVALIFSANLLLRTLQ